LYPDIRLVCTDIALFFNSFLRTASPVFVIHPKTSRLLYSIPMLPQSTKHLKPYQPMAHLLQSVYLKLSAGLHTISA